MNFMLDSVQTSRVRSRAQLGESVDNGWANGSCGSELLGQNPRHRRRVNLTAASLRIVLGRLTMAFTGRLTSTRLPALNRRA